MDCSVSEGGLRHTVVVVVVDVVANADQVIGKRWYWGDIHCRLGEASVAYNCYLLCIYNLRHQHKPG